MTRARRGRWLQIPELAVSLFLAAYAQRLWSQEFDPHGFVAGFGTLIGLFALSLCAAALALCWRSPWAWVAQVLPLAAIVYIAATLGLRI